MKEKEKIKNAKNKVKEVLDKDNCKEFVFICKDRLVVCAKGQPSLCVFLENFVERMVHSAKVDKDVVKQALELGMMDTKEEKLKYMNKMVLSSLKDVLEDMDKALED